MSYHVNRRWGDFDDDPPVERMREALDELDVEDIEHPDVDLIHDSGWCLSAYPSGLLIWGNLNGNPYESWHMRDVPRTRVLELWLQLAAGDIAGVNAEQWKRGYGPGVANG